MDLCMSLHAPVKILLTLLTPDALDGPIDPIHKGRARRSLRDMRPAAPECRIVKVKGAYGFKN
jgi:hypothetical protein